MPNASTQPDAPDDVVRLACARCVFTFRPLGTGALLVTIDGYDRGDLDPAPLDTLTAALGRHAPLTLFVDASRARGAAWAVSERWTDWFRAHQDQLEGVHILARSPHVRQTILVVKELSRTRDLMRIHADADAFGALVAEAAEA